MKLNEANQMNDDKIPKPENYDNWPTIWKECYLDGYKSASAEMEDLRKQTESMKCCGNCKYYETLSCYPTEEQSFSPRCVWCIRSPLDTKHCDDNWQPKEGK